jgi:hypothetical protein
MLKLLMVMGAGLLLIAPWPWPWPWPSRAWHAQEGAIAKAVERLTATAAFAPKPGLRPASVTLEIVIERWSTGAERDRLLETLKGKRPSALLDLLRSLPGIGHISTATSTGSSLRFAQSTQTEDGGRRIFLASERPMSVGNQPPRGRRAAAEYPFSAVDIRIDRDGNGDGTLAYASKLAHNPKTGAIEIDNYADEPVHLSGVRSVR